MGEEYQISIFIFRRDLRLVDNTALLKALHSSRKVIPLFIFDPVLIENKDPNKNAIQFMIESLHEVDKLLNSFESHLYYFYGKPRVVLKRIFNEISIDAVFCNIDYSPYAKHRDSLIRKICNENNVIFKTYNDYTLIDPYSIFASNGDRYQVFTYFYRESMKKDIAKPKFDIPDKFYNNSIAFSNKSLILKYTPIPNPKIYVNGGRKEAEKILDEISKFENYDKVRDFPAQDATTKLSAHNKFGTVSIREVYYRIRTIFDDGHPLIRQLFWRDFYVYLAIHNDYVFHHSFKRKYRNVPWENDSEKFKKWCEGKTGFPIIDAGMRQLNKTGFMHNRIRMVVASFLVKDLHINWQWGEKYFAKLLIDYDVMVNNGNWQWVASTGADAQPYFRIFNPWSQQKKYDKFGEYIHQYVEELRDVPAKDLHKLNEQRPLGVGSYPLPIVNHKEKAREAKELFKSIE